MMPKPWRKGRLFIFPTLGIILLFSGCIFLSKSAKDPVLERLPLSSYPDFSDDMSFDGLEYGIENSLSYLRRLPSDKLFSFGEDHYSISHIIRSLNEFLAFIQKKPDPRTLNSFIRSRYLIYRSTGKERSREVLFTGYYEPIITGSLEKHPPYVIPIYPKPHDLTVVDLSLFSARCERKTIIGRYTEGRILPYYDRKEIDVEKKLEGKTAPLAYLKDPIDLFFLQIQGSGKLILDSQQTAILHYHISNGLPYRSIGNYLIEKGKLHRSEISMQRIRSYLIDHPEEMQDILNSNQSYVFFKFEDQGPKGALDVLLTPGRSIALDARIFPPGSLGFIHSRKPLIDSAGQIRHWSSFSRFVLNQDTGGAIKGPGRADLFWGNGPYAEIAAGHMQHPGSLFFLILNPKR
ncbi:MAG: MltA domain-containing protein [Thermodesulfobacteriota bacterium]